ncbi:MAG: hypothetical protein R6X10_17985 [Desulfobacterales bacterium]
MGDKDHIVVPMPYTRMAIPLRYIATGEGHVSKTMNVIDSKKKEGRLLKFLFWCLAAPIMFSVFIRLFFILFRFIYAPIISFVVGSISNNLMFALSSGTALIFTIGTIVWTYKQLKKHIIND